MYAIFLPKVVAPHVTMVTCTHCWQWDGIGRTLVSGFHPPKELYQNYNHHQHGRPWPYGHKKSRDGTNDVTVSILLRTTKNSCSEEECVPPTENPSTIQRSTKYGQMCVAGYTFQNDTRLYTSAIRGFSLEWGPLAPTTRAMCFGLSTTTILYLLYRRVCKFPLV
jgi:hypothetical protein